MRTTRTRLPGGCARFRLVVLAAASLHVLAARATVREPTVLFRDDFTGQAGTPDHWYFGNTLTAGTPDPGDTFAVVHNGTSEVLKFLDGTPVASPNIPIFHTRDPLDFTATGNLVLQLQADVKILNPTADYRIGIYNAVTPNTWTSARAYELRLFPGNSTGNISLLTFSNTGVVDNLSGTVTASALQGAHRFTLEVDFSSNTATPAVRAYSDGLLLYQISAGAAGGFHPTGTDGKALRIMSQAVYPGYLGAGASYELDNVTLTALPGPGLALGPDATVLKDGRPYRGLGVNYFDCFYRTLLVGGATNTSYDAGFALLARHHIPFVRFSACGFWPNEWALYQTNPGEYFRRMDGVVASAQAHGIGLIPSLFWFNASVPDLVGESCNQWGNPASATHAFMRQYVQDVVTRYQASPAIWAWEFGNEYTSYADLPASIAASYRPKISVAGGTPAVRTAADDLTTSALATAFSEFAKTVRLYDAGRLISSGADIPRTNAWHFYTYIPETGATWATDTQAQLQTMLGLLAPEPLNLISMHCYGTNMARLGSVATAAAAIGKPLFVGEFNVSPSNTPAAVQPFQDFIAALDQANVPLAAPWVFDLAMQEADWSISGTNARSWQLEVLEAWNTQATAPASSYYGWQLAKFSPAQRLNPWLSEPAATPANDGVPNLLKYALHLEPWNPAAAGLPTPGRITVDGQTYPTLTYTRYAAATDLTFTAESSDDLVTWSSAPDLTANTSTTNPDGVTRTVVARYLVPLLNSPARFMRLRVSQ